MVQISVASHTGMVWQPEKKPSDQALHLEGSSLAELPSTASTFAQAGNISLGIKPQRLGESFITAA